VLDRARPEPRGGERGKRESFRMSSGDSIDRIRSATFPLARRGYEKREVDRFLDEVADWLESGGADQSRTELVRRDLQRIGQQTAKILTDAHDAGEGIKADAADAAEKSTSAAAAEAKRLREEANRYASETRAAADADAKRVRGEADTDAKRVRAEADDYSREVRADVDAYSTQARTEADAYAKSTRERADAYAAKLREEVEEAAARIRSRAERDAEQALAKARKEAERVVAEGNRRRAGIEKVISDLAARRDSVVGDIERLSSDLAGAATQHRRPPSDERAKEEQPAGGQPA
jgi:DivIVA domain-containing protein